MFIAIYRWTAHSLHPWNHEMSYKTCTDGRINRQYAILHLARFTEPLPDNENFLKIMSFQMNEIYIHCWPIIMMHVLQYIILLIEMGWIRIRIRIQTGWIRIRIQGKGGGFGFGFKGEGVDSDSDSDSRCPDSHITEWDQLYWIRELGHGCIWPPKVSQVTKCKSLFNTTD